MSHRPLSNTSSLKITAAYCTTWYEYLAETFNSFLQFFNISFSFLNLFIMWRPIYSFVQFVIVLRRELNCVKIPQGETINPRINPLPPSPANNILLCTTWYEYLAETFNSFLQFFNNSFSFLNLFIMWRPIFIIVQFVIVLRRELNCVKIPQGEANKSANRWVIYAPKVE